MKQPNERNRRKKLWIKSESISHHHHSIGNCWQLADQQLYQFFFNVISKCTVCSVAGKCALHRLNYPNKPWRKMKWFAFAECVATMTNDWMWMKLWWFFCCCTINLCDSVTPFISDAMQNETEIFSAHLSIASRISVCGWVESNIRQRHTHDDCGPNETKMQ